MKMVQNLRPERQTRLWRADVQSWVTKRTHCDGRALHQPADPAVAVAGGFAPDAGKLLATLRARAVGADAVFGDEEAPPLDDRLVAVVAAGVFPLADAAGEVAGVHVTQPRRLADVDDLHEVVDRRAAVAVRHLVVGVE